MIEVIKKSKKNEAKFFKALCQIDRDAFGKSEDSGMIIKNFLEIRCQQDDHG